MKKFTGKIEVIIGPMFAGKTTLLIKTMKEYQENKRECLVLNHCLDARYSPKDFLISHNNEKIKAKKIYSINDIIQDKSYLNCDVVGIDEGQFFNDIVEGCEFLANEGKIVYVSGLEGNYLRKPFNKFINLIPMAENVIRLHSVCVKCGVPASFTKRIIESKEEIFVGEENAYQPLCRRCYFS